MSERIVVRAMEGLGAGAYRIDWFGHIYRGTASGVAVVMSRWRLDPDTGEVGPDSSARTSVVIPVAFLRMFRIGDIWENGGFTGRSDVRTRETFGLAVGPDSVYVRPAGAPLDGDPRWPVFPLPFSEFDGHREHTQAFCASIRLSDDATLVIPCMELVRFYFGASGSFLKRLFSGGFALDKLCTGVRFNRATGAANIDLANDLPGAAAATVARIALNQQARNAAAWIVNSSVAASASGTRYYPKTTFPFLGETELTVVGRWLGTASHRVFLAEQLVRCTHPFPFDSLYYTTARSPIAHEHSGDVAVPASDSEVAVAADGGAELHLDECAVSGNLQPMEISADTEANDPFPDLLRKKIRRVKQNDTHHGGNRNREEPSTAGVGDASQTSDMREAEVDASTGPAPFDEASLEEAPSEVIDTFGNAVRLYAQTGAGFALRCPVAESADCRSFGDFVQASTLRSSPEPGLANVWCSVVEMGRQYPTQALALIRGDVTQDYADHLTLIRLGDPEQSPSELERLCRMFAQGTLTQDAHDRVLLTRHTQSVADLFSLLRGLSLAVSLADSGGSESQFHPTAEVLESLNAPLLHTADEIITGRQIRLPSLGSGARRLDQARH